MYVKLLELKSSVEDKVNKVYLLKFKSILCKTSLRGINGSSVKKHIQCKNRFTLEEVLGYKPEK